MHKNALFVAALVWTVVVTILCLVSFKKLPSIGGAQADKFVHFGFHFVFCVLWLLYARKAYPKANAKQRVWVVFVVAVAFGTALELFQEFFTQTRSADIIDILANTAGALGGVMLGNQIDKVLNGRQKT